MSQLNATIHIVRKDNIAEHSTLAVEYETAPKLNDGCIRAQTTIASLSSNNLSYAQSGTALHSWDAFPVPEELPAPYNDQAQYGIVPVWAYAEVLESRVAGIAAGQLIFGFWPSHDLPVVLNLRNAGMEGHFVDRAFADLYSITPSRSNMMNLYHRYIAAPTDLNLLNMSRNDLDQLAWDCIGVVTGAGWCVSQYIFGELAIHPFGARGSTLWTKENSDLSAAIVISMSASGKTARGFTNAVVHDRKPGSGPLGLLAVTGSAVADLIPRTSFPTKTIRYQDINAATTIEWIQQLAPSKIVVLDFGARANSLSHLLTTLRDNMKEVSVTIIGIGNEMKAMSPDEKLQKMQDNSAIPNRYQMNTSDVYDEAMKLVGEEQFFEDKDAGWTSFLEHGGLDGMRLEWRDSVEDGWRRLCEQSVPSDVCMVLGFRSEHH